MVAYVFAQTNTNMIDDILHCFMQYKHDRYKASRMLDGDDFISLW